MTLMKNSQLNGLCFSPGLFLALSFALTALAQQTSPDQLLLKDFKPRSIYNVPATQLAKARFPVIDMHTHNYAKTDEQLAAWVRTMDEWGIEKSVILTMAHGQQFDAVTRPLPEDSQAGFPSGADLIIRVTTTRLWPSRCG